MSECNLSPAFKETSEITAVIKIGGSAITEKDSKETLKLDVLHHVAKCIHQCHKVGMSCIIVHGAGSFGHHQAKEYEVNKGITDSMDVVECARKMLGFSLTRQSVQKLNTVIVNALLDLRVPAVSCSPGSSWEASERQPVQWPREILGKFLASGLVPVLHGDCCIDNVLGCCVLSGDTVIKAICSSFNVSKVIFLTDVAGVYDRPPMEDDAQLIKSIQVKSDGTVDTKIKTSQSAVDVTGGILLKLKTAFDIVLQSQGRIPVFVCSVDSFFVSLVVSAASDDLENFQCTKISMAS